MGTQWRFGEEASQFGFDVWVNRAGLVTVTGLYDNDYGTAQQAESATTEAPESYSVVTGSGSGGLSDLATDNAGYLTITSSGNVVELEVVGTGISPSELCMTFAAHASTGSVTQEIKLYNYDSASFVTFDTRTAQTSDNGASIIDSVVEDVPEDYVNSGNSQVKARIRFTASSSFTVYVDQGLWTMLAG